MTAPGNRRSSRVPAPGGVDADGIATLDDATCIRLIRQEHVGRLGLSVRGLPVVLPVNYVLDGRTIVFRSEFGDKTRAAELAVVACVGVDQFDHFAHSGWTVLATGRLALVSARRSAEYDRLPLAARALRAETQFIEMPIELLSGRVVPTRAISDTIG